MQQSVVVTIEPSIALPTCERALRELMTRVYTADLGADWINQVLTPGKIAAAQSKMETERATRQKRGVVQVSDRLLDYVEFHELIKIADKNWEPLSVCLGDKRSMLPLLNRFDGLRNSVAHSRDLLPHERDLLSGIAGEIRNRVTLFMSSQDAAGDYFARIESISDSFGFSVDGAQASSPTGSGTNTGQHLQVGQIVTFTCRGTDPHGRQLSWAVETSPGPNPMVPAVGDDVEVTWAVHEQHVSAQTVVIIYMYSDGPHHRLDGRWDGRAIFWYAVDPPPPRGQTSS